MKYRNMFFKYHAPMQEDGAETGGASADRSKSEEQNGSHNPEQTFTLEQVNQLLNKQKQSPQTFSEYRAQAEPQRQQEAAESATTQAVIERAAVIDSSFDELISNKLFPESVQTIRADIAATSSDKSLVEKTNLMCATAAKEFFQNEENINVLDIASKNQVTNDILSKRFENEIDGHGAWELVQRAIHIRTNSSAKSEHATQNQCGSGSKVVDTYLDDFFPKHMISLN